MPTSAAILCGAYSFIDTASILRPGCMGSRVAEVSIDGRRHAFGVRAVQRQP
jgi:hypothetical protein